MGECRDLVTMAEAVFDIKVDEDTREFLYNSDLGPYRDPLRSQRKFLVKLSLTPVQCPGCLEPTSIYAAAQNRQDNGHGVNDDDYACHRCGAKLHLNIMLIGGDVLFTLQPGQTIHVPERKAHA